MIQMKFIAVVLAVQAAVGRAITVSKPPVTVVSTWGFTCATDAAWAVLNNKTSLYGNEIYGTAVSAVVEGCTVAEEDRSITSVGYGCSPDEDGHTTLDAMVMDGRTMEAGAVAAMPDIKQAAKVALEVMRSTQHTLLVGPMAAKFAQSRGFKPESLDTPESRELWERWKKNNCQPNYRKPSAWMPSPLDSCGPYRPKYDHRPFPACSSPRPSDAVNEKKHDTIGLVAIDSYGSMAVGLSTSGAIHKMPGRVGDTPIPGSGGYVDNEVGGAVGTGDGDLMMRFVLSYEAVRLMREGLGPTEACTRSLRNVKQTGPWSAGLVALNASGAYGAACVGFGKFQISVRNSVLSKVIDIQCMQVDN
ncbi:unnamed protein product [Calicophoron daubneyi]|uniref:Aspartylglucosaminidase n=1 Tax=Calicophoron daubneyi TaxID=300641 RepID=A0AAV2TB74_CALDB